MDGLRSLISFQSSPFLCGHRIRRGTHKVGPGVVVRCGEAIGLVNSSRIDASFVGSVVATTLLTWTAPPLLYALVALPGLACLPLVGRRRAPGPGPMEASS